MKSDLEIVQYLMIDKIADVCAIMSHSSGTINEIFDFNIFNLD